MPSLSCCTDRIDSCITDLQQRLDVQPTLYKVVVMINHLFRIAMMSAFMHALPFGLEVNFASSLAASAFYNVTIERHCAFRFAYVACFGAAAYDFSKPYVIDLVKGKAFESLSTIGLTLAGTLPLCILAITIIYVSHRDVENYMKKQCCGEKDAVAL
ncbi:MAG: hypothetical protein H0X51_08635 [Parachlamydiaceae bacterium]|nr:hypothetical protein [Parachlamydiaceae bacterium]